MLPFIIMRVRGIRVGLEVAQRPSARRAVVAWLAAVTIACNVVAGFFAPASDPERVSWMLSSYLLLVPIIYVFVDHLRAFVSKIAVGR